MGIEMNYWTGAPLGWEWEGEKTGPTYPTPEERKLTVPEKNWAPRLQELGRSLYHGTSNEAAALIHSSGVLESRPEWGKGYPGVYAWSDFESAINWANFWFGDAYYNRMPLGGGGTVIRIPPEALEVVRLDWDSGNDNWKAWVNPQPFWEKGKRTLYWNLSQSFVIENSIPVSELEFYSEEEFNEARKDWEEEVDDYFALRPPFPQYVDFIGDKGPGWANYFGN